MPVLKQSWIKVNGNRLTTPGRSQQVSSEAHVVLQTISKDCSPNWKQWRTQATGWAQDGDRVRPVLSHMFRVCHLLTGQTGTGFKSDEQNRRNSTGADPLLGPLVFTSFPSISKPSVGRWPSGRAGLSPTCWQSTDRDTLTWLTDRWTCQSQREEDRSNGATTN